MFWNMLTIEHTKHFRRMLLWVELAILAGLIFIMLLMIYVTLQVDTSIEMFPSEIQDQIMQMLVWPNSVYYTLSFSAGGSIGGMLLIILVGAAIAQEYNWRTVHLWLSRGVPRFTLFSARFIGFLLPACLFVIVPFLVGAAITAIFTLQIEGGLDLNQLDTIHLGYSLIRTVYSLLPYAALTYLIALVSKSTVVAIGVSLGYSLLIESVSISLFSLVGGTLAKISQYLPGSMVSSLLSLNAPILETTTGFSGIPQVQMLEPLTATLGIAVWTALFIGIAIWVFHRQDITD
jgi:ABC-type transport system involved in multi-copper enzyme maturation permease subunit